MGAVQGVPARLLETFRVEAVDAWLCDRYGPGPFPGLVIGATSGAAAHLCAALGLPFLPQTTLLPVRHRSEDPDDSRAALAAGRRLAPGLLAANRDLALHHMHDANQDRSMVVRILYFRLKRLRLSAPYRAFLRERLAPGATVLLLDCERTWRATRVAERHWFQHGGVGGASEEEYFAGGPRVAAFLARMGSPRRAWDPPEPDERRREAEWGTEPALAADLAAACAATGLRLRRMPLAEPDDLSPLVADLHRAWLGERGLPADRLLVESYAPVMPTEALALGAVPFWARFTDEPARAALARHLEAAKPPFREIDLTLFANGVASLGQAAPRAWRALGARHARSARLVAVDERTWPVDPGQQLRLPHAVRALGPSLTPPPPIAAERVDGVLARLSATAARSSPAAGSR
jgi:hypothetical protein